MNISRKGLFTIVITISLLTGCLGEPGAERNENADAVIQDEGPSGSNEIFIYTAWPAHYIDEGIWDRQIGSFLKKKFPEVKFKHVHWDNPGRQYQDLLAAGTVPDIIFDDVARNTYRQVRRFGLEYDMIDLVKKYNFDLSALNPADLRNSINASDGKLYSLPFNSGEWVLVYNKDIFDKFGVEYPAEGITWDDAYEKAKLLTRQDGDVTYKGFQVNPAHYMMFNQLAEPSLDPDEDKAVLTSDNWLKITNNIRRFFDIPGNQLVKTNAFAKGTIAMAIDKIETVAGWANENQSLNWDFGPVPVFPEAPQSRFQPNTYGMFITNQSQNKDLAFQVIAYLLSPEMQRELSSQGLVTSSADPSVQGAFGQDLPEFRGKNIQSVFSLNSAVPPSRKADLTYIYTRIQIDLVWKPLILEESKDTATALRMANDEANKAIETTKVILEQGGVSSAQ
ncbi:ABC transporter substrate-binding protein [Paenibacillus tarimensis]